MAVAEAGKMEKEGGTGAETPGWLAGGLGWGPRKIAELRSFVGEVRNELRKVTWPGRNEVYSTTLVVIMTTIFFGFYLYALDLVLTQVQVLILR